MPDELFRHVNAQVSLNHTITRTIVRRDDGSVVVSLLDQKDDGSGGTPVSEVNASIEFSAAEWTTIVGTGFTPPPTRIISLPAFLDRITAAEQKAFNKLRDADADARVFWDRLMAAEVTGVNLDNPKLIAGLDYVKAKALDPATPADQRVWPDTATADTRIAALRA